MCDVGYGGCKQRIKGIDKCKERFCTILRIIKIINQSRTNGPINAHLTIAQVMPRYNHNNEKQEALL